MSNKKSNRFRIGAADYIAAPILLFLLSTVCALGTTTHKTFLGWKYATPTSVVELDDSVYISVVGGSVAVVNKGLEFVRYVSSLSEFYIEQLAVADGLLVAIGRGSIVARQANGNWERIGTTSSRTFVDESGRMHFLSNQRVMRVSRTGNRLEAQQIGVHPIPFRQITTFAVFGDTVVIAYEDTARVDYGLLNGQESKVDYLFDRTSPQQFFACSGNVLYLQDKYGFMMRVDRNNDTGIIARRVSFNNISLYMSNATLLRDDGVNKVVGTAVAGQDKPAFFELTGTTVVPDTIGVLKEFAMGSPVVGKLDSNWLVLDKPGHIVKVSPNGSQSDNQDYDGLEAVANPRMCLPDGAIPVLVAGLSYSNGVKPVAVEDEQAIAESFGEINTKPNHNLHSYKVSDDGSRCAVFYDEILYQENVGQSWTKVSSLSPPLGIKTPVFVEDDSTIVIPVGSFKLAYSSSRGQEWRTFVVPGMRGSTDALSINESSVVLRAADTIRVLDMTSASDTLYGRELRYRFLRPFTFTSINPNVKFAAMSSKTDGSYLPVLVDRISFNRWNPLTSLVDSVLVDIQPLRVGTFSQAFLCQLGDTTYLYSHLDGRMLVFADNALIVDKRLKLEKYRGFNTVGIDDAVLSENGVLWLASTGFNQALGLDLRAEFQTTDVEDEEIDSIQVDSKCGFIVQVFPNPCNSVVNGKVIVSFSNERPMANLFVVDMNGETVLDASKELRSAKYNLGTAEVNFSTSELSSGIYLLVLKVGAFVTSHRLCVMH